MSWSTQMLCCRRFAGLLLLGALGSACGAATDSTRSSAGTPPRASAAQASPSPTAVAGARPDAPLRGEPEQGLVAPGSGLGLGALGKHPLDGLSESELEKLLIHDLQKLGSMSIGAPSGGALMNGVQFQDNELCDVVNPTNAWGTHETIEFLRSSIGTVHSEFPETAKLHVGHISSRRGGPLQPHLSHQSGRDVDISYFYRDSGRWYARANARNLDLSRTWSFVRALIAQTDVEMILIDASIQSLLRAHALKQGEDRQWLDDVFRGRGGQLLPIIRHARGHATHLHIRFFNPVAQETARRLHQLLLKHQVIEPPTSYFSHLAKKGETLGKLARRYGTTVEAIQSANGLRNTRIMAKKRYRIPRHGGIAAPSKPLVFPPRRVPPPRGSAG